MWYYLKLCNLILVSIRGLFYSEQHVSFSYTRKEGNEKHVTVDVLI